MEQDNNLLVVPESKRCDIKILHIKGIAIRGKKLNEWDELLYIKAEDLVSHKIYDPIVLKKTYCQQFCIPLTIEQIAGEQAEGTYRQKIGTKRSFKICGVYMSVSIKYIPHNGAYNNKQGVLVPYKMTDVYNIERCHFIFNEEYYQKILGRREKLRRAFDLCWTQTKQLYTQRYGKEWNYDNASEEERNYLFSILFPLLKKEESLVE